MTLPLWRVLELTGDPGNGQSIGLDAYPIFDESQREDINRLIINHFYLREIGQETISIFTFFLARTMREIMPAYNQLYESQRIKFDPLATYDLTTVRNGTATEDATQNSQSTTGSASNAESRSVYFDTPQTALARNKDYAANATDAESASRNSGNSSGNGASSSKAQNTDNSRTTGFQGAASDLLTRYRATIINTDRMLVEDPELGSCFSLVWDSEQTPITPPRRFRLGPL